MNPDREKLRELAQAVEDYLKAKREHEACMHSNAMCDPYYGEAWLKWYDEVMHPMVSAEVDMSLLAYMTLHATEEGETPPREPAGEGKER